MELDPLAIAIETVSTKTTEVRVLTALHNENRNLNINPFSMLLSGLIDAAVGGGIKNYRIVFFNPEYVAGHPGNQERVKQLKQLIEEQVGGWIGGMSVCQYVNETTTAGGAEEGAGGAQEEDCPSSARHAGESGGQTGGDGIRGVSTEGTVCVPYKSVC